MNYEWKSRTFFVTQLKENQNIIHKFVGYILLEDSHKDLFQEVTIQLWGISKI
jgi:RNA polymerase sigma-70 factor (ECF subfamily)